MPKPDINQSVSHTNNIVKITSRNSISVILGSLVSSLLNVLIAISLTRYLGAENLGIYSFVFAYISFFNILTDIGLSGIFVRELSRDTLKRDILTGNILIMKIILSVFSFTLSFSIISFLNYPHEVKLLIYIVSIQLLISFGSIYSLIFQAHLKMQYSAITGIINESIKFGLFMLLITINAQLVYFLIGSIVSSIPGFIILFTLSKKLIKPKFRIDLNLWKKMLGESWPIALTGLFIMIYNRIDQLMLFQLVGPTELGYYSSCVRLVESLNVIPMAFMSSAFPLLSKYFGTSNDKLEKVYTISFKYLSLIIIPIAAGTTVLADPIIRFFYGEQFIKSANILKILIWSEIFTFLGWVHLSILVAVGYQKLDFIFTSTTAVVNIILNLFLISKYGGIGAAVSTTISYALGIPLAYSLKKTRKFIKQLIISTIKPGISSIVMALFIYFLNSSMLFVNILFGIFIFFILMVFIGGLNKEDFYYFKQIFSFEKKNI